MYNIRVESHNSCLSILRFHFPASFPSTTRDFPVLFGEWFSCACPESRSHQTLQELPVYVLVKTV